MKFPFKPGLTLAAMGFALTILPRYVQADEWNKKTIITVDQPIQVTDTYLEPGTYVFKLADSSSNRHIVYIYNRDENHLINTVMAIPNYHIQPHGRTQFTFWETPPGTARAVKDWFYPGDYFGQEFAYPKELRQIAVATTTTAAAPPLAEPVPVPQPEPQVQAPAPVTPAPAPQAEVQPAPPQEPVEIAQNTPPPAPAAAPEVTPAPAPAEELPKTASPYPLIGLAGLLSAGLYTLLRVKRLS